MTSRTHHPTAALAKAQPLWQALHDCPSLSQESEARDRLWLVIADTACTKVSATAVPYGSTTRVRVTGEYAHDELIAAMEWLYANEIRARQLTPDHLFATLRGIATRGALGSARAAQADLLHGVTNVPSGTPVLWFRLDEEGAA